MNALQDAIYNWLTIKVVADQRPDDTAALDTVGLFEQTLQEDHDVLHYHYRKEDDWYIVEYEKDGKNGLYRFPTDLIEVMLKQILAHPERYDMKPTE